MGGKNLARLPAPEVPYYRRSLGVVFQDFRLISDRTVEENIDIALRVLGASRTERQLQVNEMLRKVNLTLRRRHFPRELSAGEQQRCAVARALAVRPTLLLADEPTGNLDQDLAVEDPATLQGRQRNRMHGGGGDPFRIPDLAVREQDVSSRRRPSGGGVDAAPLRLPMVPPRRRTRPVEGAA